MRIPSGSGPDADLSRQRDRPEQAGELPPGRRLAAGGARRESGSHRREDAGRADGSEPPADSGSHRMPPGGPAAGDWYGSAADGAAGKGPVRGYPPVPGQPPPMYPPGQFAPWNRGRGRAAPAPAEPGRRPVPAGGPFAGQEAAGPAAPPARGSYYSRDGGEGEPGYSMLAVSDPAADVTATQTWQALGDGRATGIWTMPPDRADDPPAGGAAPGAAAAGPAQAVLRPAAARSQPPGAPEAAITAAGSGGRWRRAAGDETAETAAAASAAPAATATQTAAVGRPDRPGGRTRPAPPEQAAAGRRGRQRGSRKGRGRRISSAWIAISAAMLLVVAAAGALSYALLRSSAGPQPAARAPVSPPVAAPSPSPSLGPYGDIGSRKTDSVPLTTAQLYPASFGSGPAAVTRTAAARTGDCSSAVTGARLQSVIGAAGCSQAVRATYLAAGQDMMATIGVFNLSTAAGAKSAAGHADAGDYVSPLAARHGKSAKIGQGTGIEEAAAKGHYLILIWAERTDLHKPRTGSQRTGIENFMTQLLDSTANVSLARRMLTGQP